MTGECFWGPRVPPAADLPLPPVLSFSANPLRASRPLSAHTVARLGSALPSVLARGPRAAAAVLAMLDTFEHHSVDTAVTWDGWELPLRRRPMTRRPEGAVTGLVLARDEQLRMRDCVTSLEGLVDDVVVVVDDRTTDETRAEALALGARVLVRRFDRFDAQRNAGLDLVKTPWCLYLDCDERVVQSSIPRLRAATTTPLSRVAVHNECLVGDDPEPTVWPGDGIRLFRSHLRFSGALHETLPGGPTLRLPLRPAPIVHWKSRANARANWDTYLLMEAGAGPRLDGPELPIIKENVPRDLWTTPGEMS